MVSEKAQYRHRVLRFWESYGVEATMEAFGVKRRTLYHWRKQLREGGENPEALNEKSRAPRGRRKRIWPKAIVEEIRRLRTVHPNLGKEKLYRFVKAFCEQTGLECPKARTIGRIIADAADKMRSRAAQAWAQRSANREEKSPKGQKTQGV